MSLPLNYYAVTASTSELSEPKSQIAIAVIFLCKGQIAKELRRTYLLLTQLLTCMGTFSLSSARTFGPKLEYPGQTKKSSEKRWEREEAEHDKKLIQSCKYLIRSATLIEPRL